MSSRVYECLKRIEESIIANRDFLTDLDREIGDGDHGVNMARGFTAVIQKIDPDEADIGAVLKKVGGASGPLYGTAYIEAGKVLMGKETLSEADFQAALEAAIAGIQKRGRAVRGEKTMLDALIPALETYTAKTGEGCSLAEGLESACAAAKDGVEYTKTIAATKGRASYLGERSIGHQDPGATSATLTLTAILDFVKG